MEEIFHQFGATNTNPCDSLMYSFTSPHTTQINNPNIPNPNALVATPTPLSVAIPLALNSTTHVAAPASKEASSSSSPFQIMPSEVEAIKAKIISHSHYTSLLAAYLDCQKLREREMTSRSGNASPVLIEAEIARILQFEGIAKVGPAELARLSTKMFFEIISNTLILINSHRNDRFVHLPVLGHSPHAYAIRLRNVYRKLTIFFASINYDDFTFRDLMHPSDDPKCTMRYLSVLINFITLRREALEILKPLVDANDRKDKLTSRISELNEAIQGHEIEAKMEDPVVQQLAAEVSKLEQKIQNCEKEQIYPEAYAKILQDDHDAINEKISQADFQMMNEKQVISELSSQIVQLPDRLQAHEKLRKHLENMQPSQEQMNKIESLEKKNIKELKAKLSDENVSLMTLEAKLVDKQGKVQQYEEMLKEAEKQTEQTISELTQTLNGVRSQHELNLKLLQSRKRKAEAMASKTEELIQEAESKQESSVAKQQQLLTKLKEIFELDQRVL